MNVIDEWLDSDGAKRDALKFKNGCYISGRRCGKTAFALYQMKKYLEDHPDAKIFIPNYHYDYKELINSVYGRKKSQHDDMLDAVSEAIKEIGIKQREKMLKQSELTNEWLKRMLNNSHYGVCWPSELIDACERIDKYRKEEKNKMADHKQTYTFNIKNGSGDRYEIVIEKDFHRRNYPYRFSVGEQEKSGLRIVFATCGSCELMHTVVWYRDPESRNTAYEYVLAKINEYLFPQIEKVRL